MPINFNVTDIFMANLILYWNKLELVDLYRNIFGKHWSMHVLYQHWTINEIGVSLYCTRCSLFGVKWYKAEYYMYTLQSCITPSSKLDHPVTCSNAKNTVKHNFLISSALWHPHIVTISFLEKPARYSVPSDIKSYNSGSPGGVFIISSDKNHVIYTRVIWNNNSSWCHWKTYEARDLILMFRCLSKTRASDICGGLKSWSIV